MISKKDDFIQKVMCILCKRCSRRTRIEDRLKKELNEKDFDFEKDIVAAKIIQEEA